MSRPNGQVSYDNKGRVVLITGAAGGIGSAMTQAFVDSGATVYALDLSTDTSESQTSSDSSKGVRVPMEVDVSDFHKVDTAVQRILQEVDGIDVLVNNAAIQPVASFKPVHEIEPDLLEKMLQVNVSGYNWLARSVFPQMIKQGSGVVINLSSAHAWRSSRDVPGYGPTKAANRMQAMQWGLDYARHGIRVVSVSPGTIDTPLVRASLEEQGGEGALANRHPLGRLGKPEEVAAVVLWLASSGASFVTATDLEVDGGLGGFGSFADPYPMPERYQ